MSKASKAAAHQEDIARQREQANADLNSFLAQLVPGSEEFNQLTAEGQNLLAGIAGPEDEGALIRALGQKLVQQQQARIAAGGPATPLEARTQTAFEGLRKVSQPTSFEEDIFNALTGKPTTTPAGEVFKQPFALASAQRLGPGAPVDDAVFRNALKLVEDRVNQEYAGRGLLGGGLRLEGLGRAGVEASIAEAQRQDALRQEQNRLQQEAFQNFGPVFDAGEFLRNRGIGIEDALVKMQLGRESNLTGLLSQNTNLRLSDFVNLLERNTGQATADRLDATAQDQANRAGIGGAIGTGLGALTFAVPGLQPFAPALMAAGGRIGSGLAGGVPQTAGQFQAAQQAQAPTGTTQPLSRNPYPGSTGQLSIEEFVKQMKLAGLMN